jgi:hypothetical protein
LLTNSPEYPQNIEFIKCSGSIWKNTTKTPLEAKPLKALEQIAESFESYIGDICPNNLE